MFVEGVNLTNRPVLKYAYYENQFLYAEDSGRRYKIGVSCPVLIVDRGHGTSDSIDLYRRRRNGWMA